MKKVFAKNVKSIITTIIIAFVIVLVAVIFLGGNVKAKIDTDSITLSATLTSKEKILFNEIESVELIENIAVGTRVIGIGGLKLKAGNFKNSEYGDYKLFIFSNVKQYIIIKTSNEYFVYNLKNENLTQKSYNDLLIKLS